MAVNNVVGTCYEDAWRFLIKEDEGHLVHGSVQLSAEGPRVNHAWVELPTGWVWEPQTKSFYTIEDFQIMKPLEEYRYTGEEAAIMLARVGKHGPWTEEEKEQFLKRDNPNLEPWQMTLEEWAWAEAKKYGHGEPRIDWIKAGYGEAYRGHKRAVERALKEGKPVPPEVLADYPKLAAAQYKAEYESLSEKYLSDMEALGPLGSYLERQSITDKYTAAIEALKEHYKYLEGYKPPAVGGNPDAKEPWQMTKAEFELWYKERFAVPDLQGHKMRVMRALEAGKPVPPEVLADYPDLRTREGNPDTGTSIIDLRGDYDEIAHVKEGILYRKGNIVQVWWDKWGKETWTGPSEEQARENFNAMKERWSSSELKGANPIPEELDLARTLAIIDSRPKGRIIESKLREEFGDAVIDALRQGGYVVSGSAGYNPPLLVSLKGRELIQGGNPMAAPKTESERLSFHERIFGKGATPPLERLGRGQTLNELLPMAPDQGPPLPRALKIRWPWSKP